MTKRKPDPYCPGHGRHWYSRGVGQPLAVCVRCHAPNPRVKRCEARTDVRDIRVRCQLVLGHEELELEDTHYSRSRRSGLVLWSHRAHSEAEGPP